MLHVWALCSCSFRVQPLATVVASRAVPAAELSPTSPQPSMLRSQLCPILSLLLQPRLKHCWLAATATSALLYCHLCCVALRCAVLQSQIEKVREAGEQTSRMKVPQKYIDGHAFHTYTVTSADGTGRRRGCVPWELALWRGERGRLAGRESCFKRQP